MRFWILVILCSLSLSASAQWWHVNIIFKKHPVLPLLPEPKYHRFDAASLKTLPTVPKLLPLVPQVSQYSIELAENMMIKTAQHNMRFRIYTLASYNFSDLAHLYVQQNRLSEAKWYYLQSSYLSRQQNDDKHTISNLMALAMIKALLGDFPSSELDLVEARDMARAKGLQAEWLQAQQESKYIQDNKNSFVKTELRYADAVTEDKKTGQ